ncbi:uncharacterized protein LOC114516141 isoform X3 [Dendronephthya gigantea]|uniref:uncharacterized protein LOC114516141 isoform X3 n=1 Tax=Dendronephthya gigantea TaxID=151771 RepID=UPI00106A70BB|nr:uncharacterized protein LOC114516141 isoform X3 [Dendronephthya gigantea]
MAAKRLSTEELNFFKFASIVYDEFPRMLRSIFVTLWDSKIASPAGPKAWDDTPEVRNLFLKREGGRTKIPTSKSFEDWDCTALFNATIYAKTFATSTISPTIGKPPTIKTLNDQFIQGKIPNPFHSSLISLTGNNDETRALATDQIRLLRNALCHLPHPTIEKATFDNYVQLAKDAFAAVQFPTCQIDYIGNLDEKEFPTEKVDELKRKIRDAELENYNFLKKNVDKKKTTLTDDCQQNKQFIEIMKLKIDEIIANRPEATMDVSCEGSQLVFRVDLENVAKTLIHSPQFQHAIKRCFGGDDRDDQESEKIKNTAKMWNAIKKGDTEEVRRLVPAYVDVNEKVTEELSLLHLAAQFGSSLDIVKHLVEHGAEVASDDNSCLETVLHSACRGGSDTIVQYLLEHGAAKDINRKDSFGRSPFRVACTNYHIAVVRTLVKAHDDARCRSDEIILKSESAEPLQEYQRKERIKQDLNEKQERQGSARGLFSPKTKNLEEDDFPKCIVNSEYNTKREVHEVIRSVAPPSYVGVMSYQSLIECYVHDIINQPRGVQVVKGVDGLIMYEFDKCRNEVRQRLNTVEWLLLGLDTKVINVVMRMGDEFFRTGDIEMALNFYREAGFLFPETAICFIREAQCLIELDYFDQAKKACKKAIRFGDQTQYAELLPIINIFEQYERLRDAYDLYKSLMEKYPGNLYFMERMRVLQILIWEKPEREKSASKRQNVSKGAGGLTKSSGANGSQTSDKKLASVLIDDSSSDDMDICDSDDDYGWLDDLKSEYSSFSKDSGIPSSECSSLYSEWDAYSECDAYSTNEDAYSTNEDLSLYRGESDEERYRRVNEYPGIRTEEKLYETKSSSTSVKASDQVTKIISSVMEKEDKRCTFCGIMFPSLLDLEYHSSEPQHKVNVIRLTQKFYEKTNTSNFRPPPDAVYMGRYKECRRFEQGYCYFGKKCTFAHGKAECDHWKSLYKHQADHLTYLKERQLLTESFGEKVRLRIKYEGLDRVLTKELFGVTVDCSSPMQIKLEKINLTHVRHTWIFDVKIQRMHQPLPRQVAFLMETHLDKFKLLYRGGKQRQSPNLYSVHFVEGDFKNVARNESAVQFCVQFSSRVFGDFKQKLVFDFGKDNVLVCPLFVSVVGKYISEEETSSRTRYCHIAEWSVDKMELVPCKELTGMDLDGLCERYSIPMNNQQTDLTECSEFSRETYFDIWHNILFIEEQHIQKEVARYDIQDGKMKVVSTFKSAESTVFVAPGEFFGEIYLSDYFVMDEVAGHIINRSVMSVILRLKMEKSHNKKVYECYIISKTSQLVVIKLNEILCKEHTFENDQVVQVDLKFRYNHLPLCEMHEAIDMCKQKIDILFPNVKNLSSQKSIPDWHLERKPNTNQHKAIAMILDPNPTPPILLIGPFGTGKTFTLNLACVSILSQSEGDKVLICTHSNRAADIHLEHLHVKITENPSLCIRPLRVLNLFRNVRAVPEKLRRYCNIEETNVIQKPTWNVIRDHNVIITTLATARVLWEYYQDGKLRFTHILVDEAAQALEPECLIPLVMADENTKIVLAGDHKQMSPPVYSKSTWPEEFDPKISLLERLFSYYNSSSSVKEETSYVETPYVVLLSENYRCHEKILEFPSDNFYGGELVARGDQTTFKMMPVLSFYTAQGVDKQDEEGLSYYNDAEVAEVVARVEELIFLWPEDWAKNIGVLTPYRDQVKRIREGLRKNGLAFVDVETVENAQGKEFKALFISTVRTMWTCSAIEGRNSDPSELDFGFLSDPRFLNTAVTRAQSLLAVVGDPMSLCSVGACRDLWKDYLRRCEDNKGLHGCTLKTVLDFCIRSEPLDPSAQEFTYLKGKRRRKKKKSSTSSAKPCTPNSQTATNTVSVSSVMKQEELRCRFCDIKFSSMLELEYHYSDPQHKVNVIRLTEKLRKPVKKFRPPPDGINMGRYKVCRRFVQGYCYFGKKCTFAHSEEERDYWKALHEQQNNQLTQLKEEHLLAESFSEKLRRRIKCEGQNHVLKKDLPGVTVKCNSPKQIKLEKTDRSQVEHTWIFDVRIQRNFQLLLSQVAFLLETHLDKFKLLRCNETTKHSSTVQCVRFQEEDFIEDSAKNESAVQFSIQFSSGVFGDFEQKLVFDFGQGSVLVRPLFVSVVSKDFSRAESSRTRYCHIAEWSVDKMELVPCKELMRWDLEGLCERYSIPDILPDPAKCPAFSREKYCNIWHQILLIEERHIRTEVARYDIQDGFMQVVNNFACAEGTVFALPGEMFGVIDLPDYLVMDEVGGHLINRSVMSVILRLKLEKSHRNRVYECNIKSKTSQSVIIKLNEELCKDYDFAYDQIVQIDLKLKYNRRPMCEMHQAIDLCREKTDILLPNAKNASYKCKKLIHDWFMDRKPNPNQHEAISMILDPTPTPPILVIGPFGTGKTFTLSLACVAILNKSKTNKVLICTHSHSAAHIHLNHLDSQIQKKPLINIRPLHVVNWFRNVNTIPEKLRKYCNIEEETNEIREPTLIDIRDNNVIITTLATARLLWKFYQDKKLCFTHILIDEAAQTLEPESLTPFVMADENTKIVLAGDHQQMGPSAYSKWMWADEFGPKVSLLERLFTHYKQCNISSNKPPEEGNEETSYVETPYVVLLTENYRCHEKILQFPSDNFYGGELVARGDQTTYKKVPVLSFYTAQGVDKQDEEGLSYYNDAEVAEVVARVEDLIFLWPKNWKKNIGVLTPYRDQVKRIRDALRKKGLGYVDVETVENVQGKEFRALFISTVRTMWTCSVIEGRNEYPSELDFGFLSDPRFLNTAVTRAQSFLAVVGDPMSLCSVGACRDLWKDYLRRCEDNKGLHGCTLKAVMDFCLCSQSLDPSAQEFTYLKDDKKAKEGVVENNEKDFPEQTIIDSEHNFTKDDKKAKKTVKKSGKQNFLEKIILDSEYNIKEEVHEIFKGFSWLRGAYGITGPNKTIPRTHIYLTVKRGKKKSEVLKEIKKQFKCDPRKYFELFREPEKKPTFKYLSNPTSGGSILAVNRFNEPANDVEDEKSVTSIASGTLTMLCSQNDKHYALTCFHVGCATDEFFSEEAFNRRQRFLDIQGCMEGYENFARRQEYHYHKRGTDNADQNENIVASLPANYTRLGQLYKCCFHSESDIMSIQVDEDVQVDCGVEDIGNPDWDRISEELHRRVNRNIGDRVMVQKVGFSPNDNHKGYIVDCDYTYNSDGEILFRNAILIKGMAGTFLENGDSGALISFLDDDQVKQAFAYGVCEVDDPYSQEAMSSDKELSEDSSESGSSDKYSSSSDDDEVALNVKADGNEEFSATPKVHETKDGIVDDSDEEFVVFGVEGPLFIALNLKTGLRNLELLDKGCFSECGNTR